MNIDYEAKILEIYTIPEQDGRENVVKKVLWQVEFFDADFRRAVNSLGQICTYLNTGTLSDSFIDYSGITQQQVLQLCLDHEGGSDFLEHLQGAHEADLSAQYDDRYLTLRPTAELAGS
ncbi:hypothetical protein N8303_07845 [Gammaproteobacteria bacterium]|nr:hypothetical protein [Gammaproteobacteria bacterium]